MESSSDNMNKKKKTMGRRKIEMKKIAKKSSLQVAFSKRRAGLFKKASELSVLCGCEIAILVQSPAEKMYAFGHPSTIHRFLTNGGDSNCGGEKGCYCDSSSSRLEYAEALRKIQLENNNKKKKNQEKDGGLWFDRSIEGMEMDDLEEYLEGLQGLLGNVQNRLTQVNKNNNDDMVEGMNDNVCRAVMVDPQSSDGLTGDDDLKKLSDEIFKGMSDEDIYAAVMMVPLTAASHCSTSPSSSSLEGLVGVGYNIDVNHEMEKLSQQSKVLMSSSVDNQYNDHGGLSSSSTLAMARNNHEMEKLSQGSELVSMGSSGSVDDRGGSSSSALVTAPAQNDDHLPSPLLACGGDDDIDVTLEDVINWCREHDGFDFGQFLQN